jgi:transcriptional regulator with GAF, ATPase, and Fis domain/tetratricopeptide (TPR) repeat protein/energy-coupling factor transporter ATP-binding protein EcfA2
MADAIIVAPSPEALSPNLGVFERELTRLRAWLTADTGSVVLVHGRRGVGKDRLAEALVEEAANQNGTVVLSGRTPSAGGRSFHPYAEIVHQALAWAEQNRATASLVDPISADLLPVLEQNGESAEEAPSLDQKLRFFEGVRRLLGGIAEKARILVTVHDLERADSDTLELTSYLADELFGDPAVDAGPTRTGLLLLLVRDDAMTASAARDFLSQMTERRLVKSLPLAGLDLEGLRRYVQSPHVLEKLLLASEGLPQELDALIEALPTNVEELFERKLATLDLVSRESLGALAVSGRSASPRVLAAVTAQPLKLVAKALNDLRDAKIVDRRIHHGEFQFHFLRRRDLEVTDRALAATDRARLHGGWATALAKEPDHSGPALLAHHQLRSEEPTRGVSLAVQAAEAHAVAGAHGAAMEMLEAAEPHAQGELRVTILNRLAELAPLTGHPRRGLTFVEALKAASPAHERGIAFLREAELHNAAGDFQQALEAVARAQQIVPEGQLLERARLEAIASEALYQQADQRQAAARCEVGLAYLAQLGDKAPARVRIELLNQLGKIALATDEPTAAIQYFQETLSASEQSGLGSAQARALVNLGIAQLKKGETRRAEQALLAGIEKAREVSDLTRVAFGTMNLGVLAHQCGELGRAIECYRECRSLFRRLGNRPQLARVLHNLAGLYLLCGDAARARSLNDEALRLAKQSNVGRVVAIATVLDGLILGELGDRTAGEERLREGMLHHRKIGTERPLEAMVELAELQLSGQEVSRAEETLQEVEQALVNFESPTLRARADYLQGLVSLERGRPDVRLFERARDGFRTLSRQLGIRDTELGLARCCLLEGQKEAARMHLAAAAEIQEAVAKELPADLKVQFVAARAQARIGLIKDEIEGRRREVPAPLVVPVAVAPRSNAPAAIEVVQRSLDWQRKYGAIIGSSPKLLRVFHILDRIADSDGTVLIHGESGTGKELVAEAIHRNSPRQKGPFVKLNCAALVESLLLSELFGHERGSFTGAHQRKIGRFEMAAGGTLFLDEIGDISPKTQVALLRVLQEREFERVGGGRPIKVEARIIFATNRNLAQMVRDGTFREDLYYRLKGLTIDLPPLRDRPGDIVELAQHFLGQYAVESGSPEKLLSGGAVQLLTTYPWPGNIRELENIVRSVALFAESGEVSERDFDEYRELFHDGPALRASRPAEVSRPEVPARAEVPSQPSLPSLPSAPAPVAAAPLLPAEPTGPTGTREDNDLKLMASIFSEGIPLPELKKRLQMQAIARALRMTEGNITRAAEVLGMRRPRLSQIINANEELKALCQGVSK